jgi:hypothetical protein
LVEGETREKETNKEMKRNKEREEGREIQERGHGMKERNKKR